MAPRKIEQSRALPIIRKQEPSNDISGQDRPFLYLIQCDGVAGEVLLERPRGLMTRLFQPAQEITPRTPESAHGISDEISFTSFVKKLFSSRTF
ncbi:hypothetical protein ACE0DR_00140 [Azotobacter sp. CWF10]